MTLAATVVAAALAASPGARLRPLYEARYAALLAPLLSQVLRFQTVAGEKSAFAEQQAWLSGAGTALGLVVRDAGTFTEVELPGPAGAPVLGLVVHGDVQPADAREWEVPPFAGEVHEGEVWGRGAADDKGPLVQALLAMATLRASGLPRTSTVRLLVGSSEETGSSDVSEYLKGHLPPDYSLVLDSDFPVVVGEKAWHEVLVTAPVRPAATAEAPFQVTGLAAGLGTAIVPDRATLQLRWVQGTPEWEPWLAKLSARSPSPGTRLEVSGTGAERTLSVFGKSAHAGVALQQGRNALVSLARLVEGLLPPSPAATLLSFCVQAGQDLSGSGLGLRREPPPWNGFDVNVATVRPAKEGGWTLAINIRAPPSLYGPALRSHLEAQLRAFDERTGAALFVSGGYYDDAPLVLNSNARLIRRLLADYTRATGRPATPVTSAGGTYAKRLPRSVPFGMWFPEKPYPGHAADEHLSLVDLNSGTLILLEVLADLALGPPLQRPFEP
ncbi:MAG: M20/M25/M40 family metallo-hydrolase [Myxococcaceae bacterium]